MTTGFWRRADNIAHFLYCPALLGQRAGRTTWTHSIHLIPGRLLAAVCDRYELALCVTVDELGRT